MNGYRTAVLQGQVKRSYLPLLYGYGSRLGHIAVLLHPKRASTHQYIPEYVRGLSQQLSVDIGFCPDRGGIDVYRAITGHGCFQQDFGCFARSDVDRLPGRVMRLLARLDRVEACIEMSAPTARTFQFLIYIYVGITGGLYRNFGKVGLQGGRDGLHRSVADNIDRLFQRLI